ncbi:MAG: hypothetical protein VKN33_09565 [Candidatus Sericytochromatia bacterium]|nr:hypothetical protein [Candidatus Sericytochromatia bacterium]
MSHSYSSAPGELHHPCLAMIRPGRWPSEVVVLIGGVDVQVPLVPAAAVDAVSDLREKEARRRVLAHREALLSVWGTGLERELGYPNASAHSVLLEPGGIWRFYLDNGASISVPGRWLNLPSDAPLNHPFPVQNGRWWVWGDLSVAVEVGDLMVAMTTGQLEGPGVSCLWLEPDADSQMPPSPVEGPPLLGMILLRQEVMSHAQLETALRHQEEWRARGQQTLLGAVAVQLGYLNAEQLEFALEFQAMVRGLAPDERDFANFVLELGAVSPPTLLYAIEMMAGTGRRLSDTLVEEGWLLSLVVREYELMQQAQQAPVAQQSDARADSITSFDYSRYTLSGAGLRSLVGVILQREEHMTPEQVALVLNEQLRLRRTGSQLAFGQIALELGFINTAQLQFALRLQGLLNYTPNQPKPVPLFLLEHGVVKPSRLLQAIEEAQRNGVSLEQVLLETGAITSRLLNVFKAMQQQGEPEVNVAS